VSVDCTTVHKVDHHEPEWHAIKYDRLPERSFTSGPALKAAVDAALEERAGEVHHSMGHLLEAA
jgi:hypothetical protein